MFVFNNEFVKETLHGRKRCSEIGCKVTQKVLKKGLRFENSFQIIVF